MIVIVAAILTLAIMTIGVIIIEALQKAFSPKKRKRKKRSRSTKKTKPSIQEEIEKLIAESHESMMKARK